MNWRTKAYVGLTVAVAISLVALALDRPAPIHQIVYLAVLTLIAGSMPVWGQNAGVSSAFVFGVAGAVMLGGWRSALPPLVFLFIYLPSRVTLFKRFFNAAMLVVTFSASGWVYQLSGGPVGHLSMEDFPQVLVPTVGATATTFLVNVSLVAFVISLSTGQPVRAVWWGQLSWTTVTYLGYGVLGLLMAVLYYQAGPVGAVLVLLPLFVARQAFAQYVEQQEAYDATVRALVQAVETKDYYTRGHSERVARVTEMIARERGMREDRVQRVRYAGMLHDIGKLGVPTKVLQKQGKLDDGEFTAIKQHPTRGVQMVQDIDFLHEALAGINHHHERMDGRGYPMGLVGQDIPEFARIIMVADAFDSMTSTRSYRNAKTVDAAIGELRRCQGDQFDPEMVDALIKAVDKHGWEPNPEAFHGELVGRDGTLLPRPTGLVDDPQLPLPRGEVSGGPSVEPARDRC